MGHSLVFQFGKQESFQHPNNKQQRYPTSISSHQQLRHFGCCCCCLECLPTRRQSGQRQYHSVSRYAGGDEENIEGFPFPIWSPKTTANLNYFNLRMKTPTGHPFARAILGSRFHEQTDRQTLWSVCKIRSFNLIKGIVPSEDELWVYLIKAVAACDGFEL